MRAKFLIERGLYLAISLIMWLIGLVGFWPGYVGPMAGGTLDKTFAVHIHVIVYVGWLILFSVQSTLPMLRKGRLHRRVGNFGIGYGIVVWVFGLYVTFSRFADRVRLGDMEEARFQAISPFTDMLVFPVLFALAVYFRSQPEIHKRFMVLAGTMLMVAAVARMALNGIISTNILVFDAIWLSPVFLAIVHDAWFKRRLHPVYGWGVLVLAPVPARLLLVDSELWKAMTDWAATFVR